MGPHDRRFEELEDELRLDKEFLRDMLYDSELNESSYEDSEFVSYIKVDNDE